MRKKAILCLADGSHYEGTMFGACQEVLGELIFHTGASGYQGLLTDPAYLGQIVMLTYPLIGNNGVVISDGEMLKPRLNGLVIQELYEMQENGGSLLSLEAFFENNGATGLCGVDTRAVVRRIRRRA